MWPLRRCLITASLRRIFPARFWLLAGLALLLLLPSRAAANGGTVQVGGQVAGPYRLTVLTSPSPVRVGLADVSVLVQKAGSDDLVQDAHVLVTVTPPGGSGRTEVYEASHDLATNKLYYAAHVDLPAEGEWGLQVEVVGEMGEGDVSFRLEASHASPLENPVLLAGAVLLPLASIGGWWVVSRRRGQPKSARS